MQAKRVRCVCVLPNEFSLIHLHSFLTALPRPRLGLIVSCLDPLRPRQCCLGLGLVKTASSTSLGLRRLRSSRDSRAPCGFDDNLIDQTGLLRILFFGSLPVQAGPGYYTTGINVIGDLDTRFPPYRVHSWPSVPHKTPSASAPLFC